jgi:hypothetical protein
MNNLSILAHLLLCSTVVLANVIPSITSGSIYVPAYQTFEIIVPIKVENNGTKYVAYTSIMIPKPTPQFVKYKLHPEYGIFEAGKIGVINLTLTYQGNGMEAFVLDIRVISPDMTLFTLHFDIATVKHTPPKLTHPYLYATPADRTRINSLHDPTAKEALNSHLENALKAVTVDLDAMDIPLEGGGWILWFVCKDGNPLLFDPRSPNKYYCPTEKTWYNNTSAPFVKSAWISLKHMWILRNMLDMSLAYFLDPKTNLKYGIAVRDRLLTYATLYPSLFIHDIHGSHTHGALLSAQTLDEALLAVKFSHLFDFVYDLLDDSQRAHVEWNLLRHMAQVILANNQSINNWQVTHNAGIGAIGLVVNDPKLYWIAVDDPATGAKAQIQKGVLDDGMWFEGSLLYQSFTLDNFMWLAEAVIRTTGVNLYTLPFPTGKNGTKTLESMFLAPVFEAFPDLSLPSIGDAPAPPLSHQIYKFEIAKTRYPSNTIYDWLLKKLRGPVVQYELVDNTCTFLAMLIGYQYDIRTDVPTPKQMETGFNAFAVGIGVLRSDSNDYLGMHYGRHSAHGHYDKLNILLFSGGRYLLQDDGSRAYGQPVQDIYYRGTASHNTIAVDGLRQIAAEGAFEHFEDSMICAISNPILDTISARRLTLFLPGIHSPDESVLYDVVFIYETDPKKPSSNHNVSYLLHSEGKFEAGKDLLASTTNAKISNERAWAILNSSNKEWTFISNFTRFLPIMAANNQYSYTWNNDTASSTQQLVVMSSSYPIDNLRDLLIGSGPAPAPVMINNVTIETRTMATRLEVSFVPFVHTINAVGNGKQPQVKSLDSKYDCVDALGYSRNDCSAGKFWRLTSHIETASYGSYMLQSYFEAQLPYRFVKTVIQQN